MQSKITIRLDWMDKSLFDKLYNELLQDWNCGKSRLATIEGRLETPKGLSSVGNDNHLAHQQLVQYKDVKCVINEYFTCRCQDDAKEHLANLLGYFNPKKRHGQVSDMEVMVDIHEKDAHKFNMFVEHKGIRDQGSITLACKGQRYERPTRMRVRVPYSLNHEMTSKILEDMYSLLFDDDSMYS